MKLQRMHWLGIGTGAAILVFALVLKYTDAAPNLFYFVIGIAFTVTGLPFIAQLALENKRDQEVNEMFLEFSRNLAESVSTGTPIGKSIINMSRKNYGALSPHIVKLANQIGLGIPVGRALLTFSHEVDNPVVSRSIALISEAERAGGEIDYILESVSKSISEVEKLKKERQAAISSLIVQGYIIFFIFIGIMLVMEYKILPLAVQVSSITSLQGGLDPSSSAGAASGTPALTTDELSNLFLYLLLAQGFFTGLTVGKLSEGTLKAGIKHSFIMMVSAVLISTGVKVFSGGPVESVAEESSLLLALFLGRMPRRETLKENGRPRSNTLGLRTR